MELVDIKYLGTSTGFQTYSSLDKDLINKYFINTAFGQPDDYVEYFIYDLNNQVIGRNYNATLYKQGSTVDPVTNTTTALYLDPQQDAKQEGFNRGSVVIKYNFLRRLLNTRPGVSFWIKEISTSRTEIKVARQDLSNIDLSAAFDVFNQVLTSNNYYPDFYLNFGNDVEIIGVNAAYVEEDEVSYILFKLYEPLPVEYDLKSKFWVVQKVAEPARFQVDIQIEADSVVDVFRLRGPNYDIDLNQKVNQTTPYYNYDSLFSTTVTSSYQQLKSLFDEKAVTINTDYTTFDNFIHFSSATERINNFTYKAGLIEFYRSSSAVLNTLGTGSSTSTIVSSSRLILEQNIDNIITKFDGYEYYLYFSSASTAWPKSNSSKPYLLYPTTSSQVLNWLGSENTLPTSANLSILYSSSLYDNTNSDALRYTAPVYIREDEANQPYLTFMDMMGQHFDNIWIYYKDVTNRFSAENNPNTSISLDLVGDALRGLGIQLYTNTSVSDNIYYSLLGINPDGSLLPPTGSEIITSYVTSSLTTLSALTIEEELYKRLYHNLPYILKTKGTERGVRALIACYGIPNSILTVHEFGGYNRYSQGDIQGIQDNKIYTGSVLELTASLLSPYTTIQEYQNNTEKNSFNIEVGFSPADSINASITGTLSSLSVQQLIGNPALQYSASYIPLVSASNAYFGTTYTARYNVWDFIRIIKYYNNSLFKMLKDYVPARASLSSGIIIKSHILERNKYSRYEPVASSSLYTQSIEILTITGSDPALIQYSTNYTDYVQTLSGSIPIQHIYSFEKYTGELSGSIIQMTSDYFPQQETSYQPYQSGTNPQQINLPYLYQNVSGSVKSAIFLDLDYSSNQNTPVNYGLITHSINAGRASLTDPYAPYAQLQDYNYNICRSTIPRYDGSKLSGLHYNLYTQGDISYGNEPVINYNTNKIGFFTQVATSSILPGLVNITLAYLADIDAGLLELNQKNKSWVDVQNIFKAGTTLTIKQFDNKKYGNQKSTDGIKRIYSSGYSYTPLVYFASCSGNPTIAFENLGGAQAYYASARNTTLTGSYVYNNKYYSYISGSSLLEHPMSASLVSNFFNQIIQGGQYFATGSPAAFPTYSAQETGMHSIVSSFDFQLTLPTSSVNHATWSYQVFKSSSVNGDVTLLQESKYFYLAGGAPTATLTFTTYSSVGGTFTFILQSAITDNIEISYAAVTGYDGVSCGGSLISGDSLNSIIYINAGNTIGTLSTGNPMPLGSVNNYKRVSTIIINGETKSHGDTIMIGTTLVTIVANGAQCPIYE